MVFYFATKLFINVILFTFAWIIAPLGAGYLWFVSRKQLQSQATEE